MPITLQEAKVGMQDRIAQGLVHLLQVSSDIMNRLPFDDAVAPQGGSTLVYSYEKVTTPASAQGRKINQEYTPQEAKRELAHAKLAISGGSYQIDRVIARTSRRFLSEVSFQNEEKIKAVANRFNYMFFKGDYETTKNGSSPEFDGLDQLLEGADTNIDGTSLVLSTITKESAKEAVFQIDSMINALGEKPDVIYGNSKTILKIKQVAKELGYWSQSRDEFGKSVDTYDGIALVAMGKYFNGSALVDIIPVTAGKSDLYFVKFGGNGVIGVTPEGGNGIGLEYHLPNYDEAGAVKTGDVESISAIVLKDTRLCGKLHSITVE